MAEYERSRQIGVAPEYVFAFVSNVENLPNILPTVESMEPHTKDRIHVHGKSHGKSYDDEGWFHVDPARRRLEWGDDARNYSGWMTVGPADAGSEVVAHISIAPFVTETGRPVTDEMDDGADPIEESLESALDSLRNLMEGTGGKEDPADTA